MFLFNYEIIMTFREDNKKAAIEYFSSRPTPFGGDGSWSPLATSWRMVMLSLLGAVFTLRTGLCEEAGDDCHHQTIIIVSHQTCQQRDFHNSWRRHQSSMGGFKSAQHFQQGESPSRGLVHCPSIVKLGKVPLTVLSVTGVLQQPGRCTLTVSQLYRAESSYLINTGTTPGQLRN